MTLTISAPSVSYGTKGDDVARIQQALQAMGRDVPIGETAPPVMGAGTVAVLKALQQDLGAPVSGVVDAATVRAINAKLALLVTDQRVVRGKVFDANGNPAKGLTVSAFNHGPAGDAPAGAPATTADDGSYTIAYTPPAGGRADLRIQVSSVIAGAAGNTAVVLDTTPNNASILTDAGPLEVVDFALSGPKNPPKSEYQQVLSGIAPFQGGRALASLTGLDVSLLSVQSGYTSGQIAALVMASQQTSDAIPPEVIYGLVRAGQPTNPDAQRSVHPDIRLKALQASVSQGLIPATVNGKNITDYLGGFTAVSGTPLKGLLGGVFNDSELGTFMTIYSQNTQDPAAFWRTVSADATLGGRAPKVQFMVQAANLLNNHQPLLKLVTALPGVAQASDLVRVTEAQWKSMIQTQGAGVPPETPGASADEKTDNYLQQIVAQVEAAFPTAFFAERLPASPVKTFLQDQKTFDLMSTYPAQFFKSNPAAAQALTAQAQSQLVAFQRVHRLTGNTKETLALSAKVGSSQEIVRMDRQVFASQFKDVLSVDRANTIYDQALRTNALTLALYAEHGAATNRTSMRVLPKPDAPKQAALAAVSIPDWQTLFGSFDFCACQECASAHGPAAYFVDILSFLGDRSGLPGKPGHPDGNVRDAVFARRPDLGDIELSCKNTNTPVPLIDLVNEVLENAVVPPVAFTPFALALALEPDLAKTVATPALAAAFQPPLQPGASVEVLEAGKRWRVWDVPFAYSVAKENSVLHVKARSLQTTGSADERRATPQYQNNYAYTELANSVYPWNLPFDLDTEESNTFFAHLGVSRHDLIEALRPVSNPFVATSPVVISMAAERLGLTDTEWKIIVGKSPHQPGDFWGSATVPVPATVQELLDRSGLTYAELDALIGTWFVNPAGAVAIAAMPNGGVDTCDTARLQIKGLNAAVVGRIHPFVRLWRAMGWTIPEVDRVVRALAPDPSTPVLTDEILVRVDHLRVLSSRLRLPVPQALAFWKPIDTAEPGSLYRSLFYNPAVFHPQDDAFRLAANGTDLAQTGTLLSAHAPALQAAFRLDAASFALLLAKTDGTLNLASLSLFYRHAVLARQLGLTVQDLLTVIDLTGLIPFQAGQSEDALRFVDAVGAIESSGFSIPQLDYLLRQRFNPPVPFVPLDSDLAATLTGLRAGMIKINAPDADKQRSAVVDSVSTALSLPGDVTASLLDRVSHGGESALRRFLELSAIDPAQPLSRDNAKPQFETLEKLLKIASIIQTIDLPSSQLDWLFRENTWLVAAPDPPVAPVLFASWYSLIQLQRLRKDLNLENGAVEAMLTVLSSVANAADLPAKGTAKQALVDTLSKWLGWAADDLATLIGKPDNLGDPGILNAVVPNDYRLDLVVRLSRGMSLIKRLGVSAAQATQWCEAIVTPANAKEIRTAAKSKYDDDGWRKIVTPLQNALRDKQREAMVTYLTARPAKWNASLTKATANDLFDYFLIDVEMSSCQLSSRIKQAIGSVQLFAQRCLMGLETGIRTDDPKWLQWDWMKNFRVWEANRKIWLYPENWIEPELRDNKTPFFKDLESELAQSDLDNNAAEQAMFRYLEKIDAVSRLEIVGVYEDDDKVLHVFGRTFHTPNIYYYRRREGTSWTPWENVDLDIEGDHLLLAIFNGRLILIWPSFTEKQVRIPVTMPQPGGPLDAGERYWEIQLAWSEYKNGHWTAKNLSAAAALIAYARDMIGFEPLDAKGQITNTVGIGPLISKELISFKPLVSGETLAVRGFLRRDYQAWPESNDTRIACPFGEFRFSGCRKIVTTVDASQLDQTNFPLAPAGTKFDRMWFTGNAPSLVLFDGQFPINSPGMLGGTIISGDPSTTVNNQKSIAVLDQTSTFRLLAPHQDLQFVGDRPFFFMDNIRTFIVSSTGGLVTGPDRGDWLNGNVATAWRADYFTAPARQSQSEGIQPSQAPALTVLVPSPGGRRIATALTPVNLNPVFNQGTIVSTFWTNRKYTFANFHHPYLCEFAKILDRQGIPALLSLPTQSLGDPGSFETYLPETRVTKPHPVDEVDFQSGGAYELYNWELFFHIPLLIATRLSQNQRFEEAQKWFHYIFNPAGSPDPDTQQPPLAPQARYWRTKPFHDRLAGEYEAESVKALETLAANGSSPELDALKIAIDQWRSNPFSPDAVAGLRTTAYQKTVVMRYIDNLISWGDQLFRRDTLESINEATLIYVFAAEILGQRPEVIQRGLKPVVQTFNSLSLRLGPLGNAMDQIELLAPPGEGSAFRQGPQTPDLPSGNILYFCVPENDQLLGYWSTVGDRLFKIRHCMNIEGQMQQLPLFEPPIDPALLVRARAAGLSIAEVLADITIALPNYRFPVMLQKANEVVAEVKSLGAELLSVLEKCDAEALSTLRSSQELRLLQSVRDVKAKQVDDAASSIAALEQSQAAAQARKDYYESRDFENAQESSSRELSSSTLQPLIISGAYRYLAGKLASLGTLKIGSPTTAGEELGMDYIARSLEAEASAIDSSNSRANVQSQLAARMGEFVRRRDEWNHQANLATIELKQIDEQLLGAQIRLDIASNELRNHDQQIDNARDVDQFLRTKYTNQDLFQWMIGQVSSVYFQSYQLAYDLAKRAEMCMQHELGLTYGETSLIRFGYWDSLKKGLLAGDRLAYDLKRLDVAYLDGNIREYEMTKHVSLISLAPEQLITLKETGACEFEIAEWLFDLDTPGHYRRRIKTVSVTIPCVTGPHASVHCKLELLKSSYRQSTDLTPGYVRRPADDPAGPDDRFVDDRKILDAIVTSMGQNDSGMFDPAMRDERYLPFEGAGAISTWRLEVPAQFRSFDYQTISDVILHLRYTSRDSDTLKGAATEGLRNQLAASSSSTQPLARLVSLRHEYPSEWQKFASSPVSVVNSITVILTAARFPYFVQAGQIRIQTVDAFVRIKSSTPPGMGVVSGQVAPALTPGTTNGGNMANVHLAVQGGPGPWTFGTSADPKLVEDVFLIFGYTTS